ncbi:MAG: PilZ domain-containing protein [Phycisphaerales bacterium]
MSSMTTRRIASTVFPSGLAGERRDDPLRFDRRRAERHGVGGEAVAVFTDEPGPGKILKVCLLDASESGLGVRSPVPIAPGAAFSLMPDKTVWPRHVGIVVRCERDGDGYKLGLRSKAPRTAA